MYCMLTMGFRTALVSLGCGLCVGVFAAAYAVDFPPPKKIEVGDKASRSAIPPPEPPNTILQSGEMPIDLGSALRLAGAENPELLRSTADRGDGRTATVRGRTASSKPELRNQLQPPPGGAPASEWQHPPSQPRRHVSRSRRECGWCRNREHSGPELQLKRRRKPGMASSPAGSV